MINWLLFNFSLAKLQRFSSIGGENVTCKKSRQWKLPASHFNSKDFKTDETKGPFHMRIQASSSFPAPDQSLSFPDVTLFT